jgi:hypothetical protein
MFCLNLFSHKVNHQDTTIKNSLYLYSKLKRLKQQVLLRLFKI